MPRYFFDLYNDFDVRDSEGREFPDLKSMRLNALEEVREIMTEGIHEGHLNLNHRIEVRDETGKVIYTLRFGDAVSIISPGDE